jgi:hypothetical protein
MIGVESRYLDEESKGQHAGLAVAACVGSLIFHLLALMIVSRMDFSGVWAQESKRPPPKPFKLVEVRR